VGHGGSALRPTDGAPLGRTERALALYERVGSPGLLMDIWAGPEVLLDAGCEVELVTRFSSVLPGTVTTLAGVHLDLERYDRRRVDGLWMDGQSVDRMVEKLLGWDFQQRVGNACIGADRADLVLAGCAILEAIRRVWPSDRLRVADRGLREGILSELMGDVGVWRRGWRAGARS
jgi:hypothetical protein